MAAIDDYYAQMTNVAAQNAATSAAQQAAQGQYWRSLSAGASSSQALEQAKFAWQQKLDEAQQTGKWNGQWNNPQEQWFTGQFGQWYGAGGEPGVGSDTLAKQQQDYAQAFGNTQAFGQYYAPGTAPTQGQQTLQAQDQANQLALSQAGLTGQYQGAQTQQNQQQMWQQGFSEQQFANLQQQQQQENARAYLSQLAQLRGPADWAKYQQVLGSTPNGMRDLTAAAMGQYVPGGGATTGYQPQAANLQTMQAQIGGYAPGYGYGNQGYNQAAGGVPLANNGQTNQDVWGSGIGIGNQGASREQAAQATGNGTNTMGGQQQQYNLPAPNQIASQSWNNMAPSQQQMLLGMYEANGWSKDDVMALHNQSLPKYGTNQGTAGTWRLQ